MTSGEAGKSYLLSSKLCSNRSARITEPLKMTTEIDDGLLPPKQFQIMNYTEANFKAIGLNHLNFFRNKLGIGSDADVLEIGSGNGRIASAFTTYLTQGTYTGVDIMKPFIKWCNKAYKEHHNFRFEHINIYNKYYNKLSFRKASNYRFPFPDNRFDFIYLTSVFTHMTADEIDNYLSEIVRMLKPGALSFITYFLINNETKTLIAQGLSTRRFFSYGNHTYTVNRNVPETAIAYDEGFIRSLYEKHSLEIITDGVQYGKWRDPASNNTANHNQDRITSKKPHAT